MRKPRLDEDRSVALDEAVWRAIDGATVLQQGSHIPGSRSNERSEKREERRDEKKKPPEMLKLIDNRVC